jgi:hypothetical protein
MLFFTIFGLGLVAWQAAWWAAGAAEGAARAAGLGPAVDDARGSAVALAGRAGRAGRMGWAVAPPAVRLGLGYAIRGLLTLCRRFCELAAAEGRLVVWALEGLERCLGPEEL